MKDLTGRRSFPRLIEVIDVDLSGLFLWAR